MTSDATTIETSLDDLLNRHFAGRVVRKDLTKLVKEGANVLEYLLGTYCASNDEFTVLHQMALHVYVRKGTIGIV